MMSRVWRILLPVLLALGSTAWVTSRADAAQPAGFVYALQQVLGGANQIQGFRIGASAGARSALPGFPRPSGGNGGGAASEQLAYDAANGRLYAINDGSQT